MEKNNETAIVRMGRQGSPAVLEYGLETIGTPNADQVVLNQKAIALNFVDVMFQNGTFPLNNFPVTIGVEAAGIVESVGENVKDIAAGDRVGYFFALGAYAERRLINASELIKLPDDVSFDEATAIMAKGLTARMLIKQAYSLKEGDTILVHAAAGGVGSLVSRWAKALGAIVIGSVGNSSKKSYALSHGIDLVVALDTENLTESVDNFTKGKGVDAVFDGVGNTTFNDSLNVLKTGGTYLLFGNSSGVPDIDNKILNDREINFIRPSLGSYFPDKASIQSAATEMFDALRNGILGEINPTVYSLSDVAKAHQDLESGTTKGSIIFHI
ncbi:quinone oxidoreductase family protein [Chryseobacterium caseinilyticum]|uniref:Quinone oxidoreductase n=1 Tax=Chryseobacterium caseinilyticum TaxID=2771428 RepID=A0ABR8Z6U9_9FLAO|nr:quinone oxidoreductase [Chryseobacterium caseinilyticum]MBD8081007.1 quinone oxidoreductase [Chryseobacterium caseinilyticum]